MSSSVNYHAIEEVARSSTIGSESDAVGIPTATGLVPNTASEAP